VSMARPYPLPAKTGAVADFPVWFSSLSSFIFLILR